MKHAVAHSCTSYTYKLKYDVTFFAYNTKCKYIAKERSKDSNALLANSIMCYQKKKVKYTK